MVSNKMIPTRRSRRGGSPPALASAPHHALILLVLLPILSTRSTSADAVRLRFLSRLPLVRRTHPSISSPVLCSSEEERIRISSFSGVPRGGAAAAADYVDEDGDDGGYYNYHHHDDDDTDDGDDDDGFPQQGQQGQGQGGQMGYGYEGQGQQQQQQQQRQGQPGSMGQQRQGQRPPPRGGPQGMGYGNYGGGGGGGGGGEPDLPRGYGGQQSSPPPPPRLPGGDEPPLPGGGGGGYGGSGGGGGPYGPSQGEVQGQNPPGRYPDRRQQQQQQGTREGPPPPPNMPSSNQNPYQTNPDAPTSAAEPSNPAADPNLDLSQLVSQLDKDLIFRGLKRMYRKKIMPLEIASKYGHFHSSPLSPSDFEAKPMVLLLGQYSVGKTSFIRYLLGRDFPGIRIGPEPTTDRFTAIMDGPTDKITPGAALCAQADRPFRGLSPFGNNFLSRMEGVEMDSPILKNITLVDTPGILSGRKQSMGRNYDYEAVMRWFAERADLIIIMFDAHKLDISDELKRVIELMKPHADKVRVVLNKADAISTQQLMRVYGALMWSLGKVMNTPEVCRVYMGSFWGEPLQNQEQARLLTQEKMDLFNDIAQLPQNAVMRRINELVKRVRSVKVHAYIIHYLRKQLPYTWGKRDKQARLIGRLDREFIMCARRYELPRGDFPDLEPFRQALEEIKDLSEFPKLDKKMVKEMDKVFSVDIPELLEKARAQ